MHSWQLLQKSIQQIVGFLTEVAWRHLVTGIIISWLGSSPSRYYVRLLTYIVYYENRNKSVIHFKHRVVGNTRKTQRQWISDYFKMCKYFRIYCQNPQKTDVNKSIVKQFCAISLLLIYFFFQIELEWILHV